MKNLFRVPILCYLDFHECVTCIADTYWRRYGLLARPIDVVALPIKRQAILKLSFAGKNLIVSYQIEFSNDEALHMCYLQEHVDIPL